MKVETFGQKTPFNVRDDYLWERQSMQDGFESL